MSFRLNAALFAALSMSVAASLFVADMSSASEPVSPVAITMEPTASPEVPAPARQPVIFGESRPVVQPTPSGRAHSGSGADASERGERTATSLAALVEAQDHPESLEENMRCLAGAIYFEAKGESLEGQLAVARVVINREKSGQFADSLCGVVYQRGQFSFVRGGSMPTIPVASRDWREAVAIAQIAMNDEWDSKAEGALFFHARRVAPGWGKARLAAIDNHIFYR